MTVKQDVDARVLEYSSGGSCRSSKPSESSADRSIRLTRTLARDRAVLPIIPDEQVSSRYTRACRGTGVPGLGTVHEQGPQGRRTRSSVGGDARGDVQQLRRADRMEDAGSFSPAPVTPTSRGPI